MKDERPDLRKEGTREPTFSEFVGKAIGETFTRDELKSLMEIARKAGYSSRDKEVAELIERWNCNQCTISNQRSEIGQLKIDLYHAQGNLEIASKEVAELKESLAEQIKINVALKNVIINK